MKEHKKLYKAGKNWLVATIAIATMGVVASQQNVHAADNAPTVETTANMNTNSVQSAQQAVSTAQETVTSAQQAVNQASAANEQAQQGVTNAQNSLSEATKAQQTVHTQAEKDAMAKTVQSDQAAQSSAQQAVNQANADLKTKQSAKDQAQSKADSIQQQLNDLKAMQNLPSFNFTDAQKSTTQAYFKAVKKVMDTGSWSSAQFTQLPEYEAWKNAMTGQDNSAEWQDLSSNDQNEQINLGKMTTAQVQELSQFAVAVINSLRAQLGLNGLVHKAVVTTGMVDEAKEVSDLYNEANSDGHYIYALKKAAFDHGLISEDATDSDKVVRGSNSLGESYFWEMSSEYTNTLTMAEAKSTIVNAIESMLFNDASSNMGHAESLAGIYTLAQDTPAEYTGVSMSYEDPGAHEVHFIQFEPYQLNAVDAAAKARQAATHVTEEIANPYDDAQDPAKLQELQNKLNDAKSALKDRQSALDNSQAAAKAASQKLEAANNQLAQSQKQLKEMQNEKSPAELQKDVDTAKANLKSAQAKADQTAATLKQNQAKLVQAKQNLAQAQAQLTAATNKATNDQQEVANKNENSSTSTNGATKANESNNTAESNNTSEFSSATGSSNTTTVNEVAKSNNTTKASVVNDGHVANIQAGTNHATALTATKALPTTVQNGASQNTTAQQELPQTGNQQSAAAAMLGIFAAMFGFGLSAKKRQH